jgi:hypothetical protein
VKERLTQERIEVTRKRLGDATPGTWGPGKVPGTIVAAVTEKAVEESGVTQEVIDRYGGVPVASDVGEADRELICQAKEDIGRLLEDREQLRKRIAELEEQKWRGSRGQIRGRPEEGAGGHSENPVPRKAWLGNCPLSDSPAGVESDNSS